MQKAEKRLSLILKKLNNSDIPNDAIASLGIVRVLCGTDKFLKRITVLSSLSICMLLVPALVIISSYFYTNECFLESPVDNSKIFREAENCNLCIGVNQVDKVKNISPSDFEENYTSKIKPVVVTDGTKDWSSIETFTFDFFKKLYESTFDDDNVKQDCQFFPYKTNFKSLQEALSMNSSRSRLEPGTESWYIGWSNCNDHAGKIMRRHYRRPYFLPDTSENLALSWIFMGGPGYGAHMHVDNVQYPSWQAQLSGRKRWRLVPPPECIYRCQEIEVIVEPGEIIVIDTNRWYHQTFILPGDLSITIGSEFD